MSDIKKICRKIEKLSPKISVSEERGCIVLRGQVDDWSIAVKAGQLAVNKKKYLGVINDIKVRGFEPSKESLLPEDSSLEGQSPDVLIIGGGITGCAAARQLSRYKLNILVCEKGADVASGASKANGGVVHVGINFSASSQKQHYNLIGNQMYEELSKKLDVPFERRGQVMLCCKKWERIVVWFLARLGEKKGIHGTRYMKRKELLEHEPNIPEFIDGGMFMPIGGITSPYEMTIAMAENAATNGVSFSLETQVRGMEVEAAEDGKGHIVSVTTNRGKMYPKVVINAAGVHADEIADMAGDRTFTIHPRRGTDIITDKKVGYMVNTSMAKAPFAVAPYEKEKFKGKAFATVRLLINAFNGSNHTKGVGVIHSVHGNMLIGPNAVETPDREDTATYRDEVDAIIRMQQHLAPGLEFRDIIAYFTGVRAPTYEEDFVVRKGIFTDNILEAAGIQSPGVTAAPAIAVDLAEWTVEELRKKMPVEYRENFSDERKAPPRLRQMREEERHRLIRENPDYGVIVCRCEEISRGEIIDALNSPLPVPTVDGIKRRLRPGMGRCQGGFCMPLVMDIIAQHEGVPLSEVRKAGSGSVISYGFTKGEPEGAAAAAEKAGGKVAEAEAGDAAVNARGAAAGAAGKEAADE